MADQIMSQIPNGSFAFAGFSLGSYVALHAMQSYGERVDRLALISASPFADNEFAITQRKLLIERANIDFQALLEEMGQLIVHADGEYASESRACLIEMGNELGAKEFCSQQRAAMNRGDYSGLLDKIKCPTAIICGLNDIITPPSGSRYLAEHINNALLVELPSCGHLLPLEQPRRSTQFLQEWLKAE